MKKSDDYVVESLDHKEMEEIAAYFAAFVLTFGAGFCIGIATVLFVQWWQQI